jgi:hypothetical protein
MKLTAVFRRIFDYWVKPVDELTRKIRSGYLSGQPLAKKLAVSALLSAVAAALQSAGALGGVGFVISAFVTLPIAVAMLLSVYSGLASYAVTLCLLVLVQPSELIIFPFTTGLLGLSVGLAYRFLNRRITAVAFNALCLTFGIALLLYVFKFPVLGPVVTGAVSFRMLIIIFAVSLPYAWFWTVISGLVIKALGPALKGQA